MILVTIPGSAFNNWTLSGSLKSVLILGVASTSSLALVTSISKSEQTKDNLKSTLNTAVIPFKPFAIKLGEGSSKMLSTLGEWAQHGQPIINAISESFVSGSVSAGARAIFHKLKEWLNSIYEMLKTYGPILFSKELWGQLKSLSQIIKNLLNSDMNGNTPLIFSFFKAAGKKEFGEFMSEMGKFAEKQSETIDKFSVEDMKELFNAFNGDPDGTKEILKEFASKQENNGEIKEKLMQAIKPASLKGKIEAAIENAKTYLNKGRLTNDQDRQGAEKVRKEIQELKQELKKVIEEAKRKVKK